MFVAGPQPAPAGRDPAVRACGRRRARSAAAPRPGFPPAPAATPSPGPHPAPRSGRPRRRRRGRRRPGGGRGRSRRPAGRGSRGPRVRGAGPRAATAGTCGKRGAALKRRRAGRPVRPLRPVPPRSPLGRLRAAARLQQRQRPRPHGGPPHRRAAARAEAASAFRPRACRKCPGLPPASVTAPGSAGLRFRPRVAVPRWRRWTWTSTWRSLGSASTCPRTTSRCGRGGGAGAGRARCRRRGRCRPALLPQRLCDYVCDLLLEESNVQPVSTPVTVCGDIHGQVTGGPPRTPAPARSCPARSCPPGAAGPGAVRPGAGAGSPHAPASLRSSTTCASCSGRAVRSPTPTTSSWYAQAGLARPGLKK